MNILSVFKLIINIGLVFRTVNVLKTMIQNAVSSEHKLPSCDDMKDLMDLGAKLISAGIIDIPNVDEKKVAESLIEMRDKTVCSIDQAQLNAQKYGDVRGRVGVIS